MNLSKRALAAVCVFTLTASVASAQVATSFVPLGHPGSAVLSTGNDINDAGTMAVTGTQSVSAWLWDSANGWQDIGSAGPETTAFSINDSGEVVGRAFINGAWTAVIRSTAGVWSPISGMDFAYAINNNGQVLGSTNGYTYFVWHPATGLTPLPAGLQAVAINDAGVVAGRDAFGGFTWDPVFGTTHFGGSSVFVTAINNLGQVTGNYTVSPNVYHAFFYDPATGMHDIPTFGAYYDDLFTSDWVENGRGTALNDLGQVVGHLTLPSGVGEIVNSAMFVWDAVSGLQLLSYANGGSPLAINNHGEIAGFFNGNYIEAFYATVAPPIPPTPQGQTAQITASIATLVSSGVLTGSSASQVTNSLDSAMASLAQGNAGAAKNQLGAAVNKVKALVNSRKLSAVEGQKLTDAIGAVAAGL
jgi:probable HAF family extracellular repeat protein